jgi:hypothetical protein
MIIITTPIIVNNVQPVQIYDWIVHLTPEKYRQWDPIAHIGKIKRPTILNEGDSVFFEEKIECYKINLTWKIIKLNKPDEILMKAVIPFPVYLQLKFLSDKSKNNTEVIHELTIGFRFPGLEKIVDLFISTFIMHRKKIAAIKRHAINEFKNLENIL